jgi:post-segregation antitoxin (ccd killing protein)
MRGYLFVDAAADDDRSGRLGQLCAKWNARGLIRQLPPEQILRTKSINYACTTHARSNYILWATFLWDINYKFVYIVAAVGIPWGRTINKPVVCFCFVELILISMENKLIMIKKNASVSTCFDEDDSIVEWLKRIIECAAPMNRFWESKNLCVIESMMCEEIYQSAGRDLELTPTWSFDILMRPAFLLSRQYWIWRHADVIWCLALYFILFFSSLRKPCTRKHTVTNTHTGSPYVLRTPIYVYSCVFISDAHTQTAYNMYNIFSRTQRVTLAAGWSEGAGVSPLNISALLHVHLQAKNKRPRQWRNQRWQENVQHLWTSKEYCLSYWSFNYTSCSWNFMIFLLKIFLMGLFMGSREA